MKFARYLDDTQIPEWKKVYIDFKGLKKQIGAIGRAEHVGKVHHQPQRGAPDSQDRPARLHGSSGAILLSLPQHPGDVRKKSRSSVFNNQSRRQSHLVTWCASTVYDENVESRLSFSTFLGNTHIQPYTTINTLYASLNSVDLSFFAYLDHELAKVDNFYINQEDAAVAKLSGLRAQLPLLQEHLRLFHEATRSPDALFNILPRAFGVLPGLSGGQFNVADTKVNERDTKKTTRLLLSNGHSVDPNAYRDAERKLRKAFQEFYRGLELLNDYRVLNLTGFRKVLKKYEKVTQRPSQDLYMREKVHSRRFASSVVMSEIMQEVEDIFATRFEQGDRKEARRRLKVPFVHKTHHYSAFRSGIFVGVAIPALVFGLCKSFQPQTRHQIPEWGPLLVTYSVLFTPVIFALLVGLNLIAWSRARINFTFILDLDVNSVIDIREYFELPAILFATLACAFLFSFLDIGGNKIAPWAWPAIWIGFALVVLVNPFPILSRPSRYWLLRALGRLLVPGTTRVDFTDFWMGDQLCSLSFPLTQLFTVGCAYSNKWRNVWDHCGSGRYWPILFMLLTLPYFVRVVQSIRRYYDSGLPSHLINAGKYFSSVIANLVYYVWEVRGHPQNNVFVIWCLFATISSIYHASWDFLMDWSLLSSHRTYNFLRKELIYSNNPLVYYFAIVSNVVIRFIWVIYVPSRGPDRRLRAFIANVCELGRRIQWNFYRLENEQIGNADQYRATREVSLPYPVPGGDDESDTDTRKQSSNISDGVCRNFRQKHISDLGSQDKQEIETKELFSPVDQTIVFDGWSHDLSLILGHFGQVVDIK